LGPRDVRSAARTAAWIYLVSAIVALGSTLVIPPPGDPVTGRIKVLSVLLPLLLFGGLLAAKWFRYKQALLLVTPLFGTSVVLYLNLATNDASAGAQVTFCLPVLFAASQLRFLGAGVAAVASISADVFLVLRFRSDAGGMLDVIDVSLVVLLMTGLLVIAGRRQDRLVALLESQASLDPLTGLVTRRVLDEAVRNALSTAAGQVGTALILVDLDHFKSINDGYGHPVGDDTLMHVARLLGRLARPDTVISRLGGDEIAVLLPGCTEAVARERAEEFLLTVRENPLVLADGTRLPLSISLGVAHAPLGQSHPRELYASADASLYLAKRAGRGRVGQASSGHPLFEPPTSVTPGPGSECIVDGTFEMRHVPDGVLQGDVGLPGDDRIDHR
jgi:diguanylate cyclase (GGDEF)-like protein